MKKNALKVLVLCMVFILVMPLLFSAGGTEAKPKKEVIIFASVFNPGQPQVTTQHKFKELFEERSNGKYEVRVITSAAMGGAREHLEAMQEGSIHLVASGPEGTAIFNPTYDVENIPFLFEDWDHLYRYLDGEPGKIITQKILDTLGVRNLGYQVRGARQLTADRPEYSRDDLKGLRMRLSETEPLLRIWGAVGASPLPIAFNELYTALQTKMVRAQENPVETIYGQKFYEVQDYMMETDHVLTISYFQASEKWFKTLSDADRNLLLECMKEAIAYGNEIAVNSIDKLKKEIVDNGWMTIIPRDQIDIDSIRIPALAEVEKMVAEGKYDQKLYQMALDLKKK